MVIGGEYEYHDVEFTVNATYGNHGIGADEYWGFKGRDDQFGWELDDYEWDKTKYTDAQNKAIEEWAEKNYDTLMKSFEND